MCFPTLVSRGGWAGVNTLPQLWRSFVHKKENAAHNIKMITVYLPPIEMLNVNLIFHGVVPHVIPAKVSLSPDKHRRQCVHSTSSITMCSVTDQGFTVYHRMSTRLRPHDFTENLTKLCFLMCIANWGGGGESGLVWSHCYADVLQSLLFVISEQSKLIVLDSVEWSGAPPF